MNNKTKIYFLENSYNYNALDLDTVKIAGSEKTLINITNELAKDNKFIIKGFNNTTGCHEVGLSVFCSLFGVFIPVS